MDSEPMLSVLSVVSRLCAADVFIPSELHSSNTVYTSMMSNFYKSIIVTYQSDLQHFE